MTFKRLQHEPDAAGIDTTARAIAQHCNIPAAKPAIRLALSDSVDRGYNGWSSCDGRGERAGYLVEANWWNATIRIFRILVK